MCNLGSGSRCWVTPGRLHHLSGPHIHPGRKSGRTHRAVALREEIMPSPLACSGSPSREQECGGGRPAQETSFSIQVAQLTAPLFSGYKPETAKQKPDSCWMSPL